MDYSKLELVGARMLVKRNPKPAEVGGLAVVGVAAAKKPCPSCTPRGANAKEIDGHMAFSAVGCFVYPVYEEDGLRISKWVEVECEDCAGRGYRSKAYDPLGKVRDWWAKVLAVGPGEQCRKELGFTGEVLYWKDGRRPMPAKVGDEVLLAYWAGMNDKSWEIDDEHLIVNTFEVLAVRPAT